MRKKVERQPILGPNAKPLFIQTVIGVSIYLIAYNLTYWWLPDLISEKTAWIFEGALLCEYVTC